MFRQITILGVGLLGGSVLKAIKAHNLADKIIAWSPNILTRNACEQLEECDEVAPTARDAVRRSDFVILCPPVDSVIPLLKDIEPCLDTNTIVTDVGSTKYEICVEAHRVMHMNGFFVGSHPMAGSEKQGLEHSDSTLFQNKTCFVTPFPTTDPMSVKLTQKFWEALKMNVEITDPKTHDKIVANVSHLPHLLASALAAYLEHQNPDSAKFAGTGLRDTTRIAASDPALWLPILTHNKEEVLQSLRLFEKELTNFKKSLEKSNEHDLLKLLKDGKTFRDKL